MADEFQTSRSSDDTSSEWIRTELESVDIGDKRLNARVLRVIDTFWKQPQASIPKATGSWSEFKAAYRLLNNPKVTAEKILAPHRESVRSRMEGHRVVLAVQDTTDLNFTSHPATEGLGTIGSSPTLKGMHVHTTVAVTPERVPLGLIQQQTWIRPENEFGKKTERRKKVFEEKESVKWLHSLQAVEQLQAELPLSWMLLTTIPVSSAEDALIIADYYSVRWAIEVFHRILKSGCRIEERQLQTADGLRKCLALDSLVAWRIQFLTAMGREVPNLPCDVVFEDYEWKALYCFVHRTTQLPERPPTLSEAIRLVARVGGFLARKGDGAPGPMVLWRGLQELATISCAWFAFGPERAPP
jgi:hypothetical protein